MAGKSTANSSEQRAANEARRARIVVRNSQRNEEVSKIEAAGQTPLASNRIPLEIWLEIFSYVQYDTLKKMHLVSKGFCNILAAPPFNKMLFRPGKDDLPVIKCLKDVDHHPFLDRRNEYVGPYRGPYEDVWLFCRGQHRIGEICLQSDQAPCHAVTPDTDIWRFKKKWHFKKRWQSIADESACWPPLSRSLFDKYLGPADTDCKFLTVFDFKKAALLLTAHHAPGWFLHDRRHLTPNSFST